MNKTMTDSVAGASWPEREARWQKRLRRLRLGAEPIEDQLVRFRRVTIVLTIIGISVGLMFLSIFAAFGRVDVGAIVVGILLGPVIALAWLDHAILRARAAAYLRDLKDWQSRATPPA
ncbi:hypothetical protein P12x_004134 [Tundrisphaera lichenicola]|uniref:hypothetical protein n=1 Tax=Tundrisphaera lichenicola TaxID=2029860 RepID=UPI003EB8B878